MLCSFEIFLIFLVPVIIIIITIVVPVINTNIGGRSSDDFRDKYYHLHRTGGGGEGGTRKRFSRV